MTLAIAFRSPRQLEAKKNFVDVDAFGRLPFMRRGRENFPACSSPFDRAGSGRFSGMLGDDSRKALCQADFRGVWAWPKEFQIDVWTSKYKKRTVPAGLAVRAFWAGRVAGRGFSKSLKIN